MTMYTATPTPRLKTKEVGDRVLMDIAQYDKPFTVYKIREDGYYELVRNGKVWVTASPDHVIKVMQ